MASGAPSTPLLSPLQEQQQQFGWQLEVSDVKVAEPTSLRNLQPESLLVHLPLQLEGRRMRVFSAQAVRRCACELPEPKPHASIQQPNQQPSPQQPSPQPGGRGNPRDPRAQRRPGRAPGGPSRREFATDSVFYAGAPVWSLDFCPWPAGRPAPGPINGCELLAVSTHPKDHPRTRIGAAHRGPGAIQLWGVPHSGIPAAAGPGDTGALPRCLALIQHDGRLAWEVRWCPEPSALLRGGAGALAGGALTADMAGESSSTARRRRQQQQQQVQVQGLLAAVLGDGSVELYAVPAMHVLKDLAKAARQQQQQQQQQQPEDGAAAGATAGKHAGAAAVQSAAASAGCSVLDLDPVASLLPSDMGGSLASCCCWSPQKPHDLLLVGSWDGHTAVWRLPTADGGGVPSLVMRIRAEPYAIRCVAWQPDIHGADLQGDSDDSSGSDDDNDEVGAAGRAFLAGGSGSGGGGGASSGRGAVGRSFVTASQWGDMKIWDPEDPFSPAHLRSFPNTPIASVVWVRDPGAVVMGLGDGGLRVAFTSLVGIGGMMWNRFRQFTQFLEGADPAPLWSVSYHPHQRVAAFCGDAGVVGLVPIEPPLLNRRHQKPAAALSATAVDGDDAWLLTSDMIPGNGGLYAGGAHHRDAGGGGGGAAGGRRGILRDPKQALHAVSFSVNSAGGACFLASGGAAGLVRVQRLMVAVEGGAVEDEWV